MCFMEDPILPSRLRILARKQAGVLIYEGGVGQALIFCSQPHTFFFFFDSLIEIEFTFHAIHPLTGCNSMIWGIFIEFWKHHCNQFNNVPITPQRSPRPISGHSCLSCPQPLSITSLVPVSVDLPLLDRPFERNRTTCGLFCVWLLSLSIRISRLTHNAACITTLLLFTAK